MRARLLPGLAIVAALSLTGCMADDFQANSGTGRVSVDVSVNSDVKDAAISRTTASTISADDLMLRLSSEDGSFSKEWKLNEFPTDGQYVIGNYLLEAYYGTEDNEGFEKPYYYGSTTFQIKHNQTSSVSLEVGLGNSMITLEFEESFKNYLEAYSAILTTSSGKTHEYTATDEQAQTPIYVKSGNVSLALNCTLPTGTSGSFHVADFTVEPKNHYKMKLGINFGDPTNPGAGAASLSISFDDALEQEPITIEISDELFNAPGPVITPSFDTTQPLSLPEGDSPTEALGMTLLAQGGFANVVLTTESASLLNQGWPAEIELLSATASQRDKLSDLGLKVLGLYQNPDQMAQLDFTDVASHLSYIEGASNNSIFTVKVTDGNGKESQPVSFTITTTEIKCAILSHFMMVGTNNLKLNISYNGKNAKNDVQISYKTGLGSYTQFTVDSFTDNGDGTYSYDLTTSMDPKESECIEVRIMYMGKKLDQTLECGVPEFSVASCDAFATYALVDFVCDFTSESLLKKAQFSISKDGGDFSNVATEIVKIAGINHLKISGLTPSSNYAVKCSLLGKESTNTASFTTEASTQLPNSGMEDWFTVDGKTKFWWVEYPGTDTNAVWGTMNLLTTSEGGSNDSNLSGSRDGMSYCAFSGTRKTTDSHSGNAAIIETVGWGKGNSAASSPSGCKNFTVGQLYLGSYDTASKSPTYGYSFASRPASLSFWYKYSPKNSADYGTALIKVLNSSGEVISEKQADLTSKDSYTQVELPLSYSTTNKAAQIVVVFTSSGNQSCQSKDKSNMSLPSVSKDGRYTGSSLYIDDIVLNY